MRGNELRKLRSKSYLLFLFFSNDASMIFVSVGFGFFVEFTLTEAVRFIGKKTDHLTRISDSLARDASRIKAHIKLVLEVSRIL